MHDVPMYEIWWSKGFGTHTGPRFRKLEDALRYVHDHAGEASYAIRHPEGHWCKVDRTNRIASRMPVAAV